MAESEEELPDLDDIPPVFLDKIKSGSGTTTTDTDPPKVPPETKVPEIPSPVVAEIEEESVHLSIEKLAEVDDSRVDSSSTESSSETETELRKLAEFDAYGSMKMASGDSHSMYYRSNKKDRDGFLPPPPPPFVIKKTKGRAGSSTYVVSPVDTRRYSDGHVMGNGDAPHFKPREGSSEGRRTGKGQLMKSRSSFAGMTKKSGLGLSKYSGVKRGPGRPPLNPNTSVLASRKSFDSKRRNRRWSFPFQRHRHKPGFSQLGRTAARRLPDQFEDGVDETGQRRRKSLTWRPVDDYRLIVNTIQTHDLKQVHMGVKFSCHFTLEEIRSRWASLMYNEQVSKVALTACRNLHSKVRNAINAETLFSPQELKLLQGIHSKSNPTLSTFRDLLRDDISKFFNCRTAVSLMKCWHDLKSVHMLVDQNVESYFEGDLPDFADFESTVSDEQLLNYRFDQTLLTEVLHQERKNKKRIRILEQEINTWQALSDLVLEGQIVKPPELDDSTYALIRGKNVRFIMAAKEISLGRRTSCNWVDANLSEEGSDVKISRRQAIIKMRALGDFVILNQGKHRMYVDGRALLKSEATSLHDQSVIRVANLNFVFIINEKLLREQQQKVIEEESSADHVDIEGNMRKVELKLPRQVHDVPKRAAEPDEVEQSNCNSTTSTPRSKKSEGASAPRKRKVPTVPPETGEPKKKPRKKTIDAGTLASKVEAVKKPVRKPRAKKPKADAVPASNAKPPSNALSAPSSVTSSSTVASVPSISAVPSVPKPPEMRLPSIMSAFPDKILPRGSYFTAAQQATSFMPMSSAAMPIPEMQLPMGPGGYRPPYSQQTPVSYPYAPVSTMSNMPHAYADPSATNSYRLGSEAYRTVGMSPYAPAPMLPPPPPYEGTPRHLLSSSSLSSVMRPDSSIQTEFPRLSEILSKPPTFSPPAVGGSGPTSGYAPAGAQYMPAMQYLNPSSSVTNPSGFLHGYDTPSPYPPHTSS